MSDTPKLNTLVSSRACQSCARAKAKCAPQPTGSSSKSGCSRCARLGKDCIPVPRSTRKRRAPNTTTAKLEQKIENLVNLLANTQGLSLNQQQQHTPPESCSRVDSPAAATQQTIPAPCSGIAGPWTPLSTVQSLSACSEPLILPGALQVEGSPILHIQAPTTPQREHFCSNTWTLSDHDGDVLLSKFKEMFLPHFPFIPLDPNMSLAEFKMKRPHVLKAIWTIAFQDNRKRQIEMGKDLMVDVSTSMLVRGDKDLDMLQGLVLINAWSYFVSPMPPATKTTAYFQLALALLFDLKLSRPMREVEGSGDILADFKTRDIPECMMNDTARRSSDDCRALLCCYYLGSIYALSVKRTTEGLPFSSYIEYCCETLEQRAESNSDILLVALVRLECLVHPIDELLTKRSNTDSHNAPISMHINAIRTNLERFWESLHPDIQKNPIITLAYQSSKIYIHEPIFYASLFVSPSSTSTSTSNNSNSKHMYSPSPSPRLDLMHTCLLSCKSLFDTYLSHFSSPSPSPSSPSLFPPPKPHLHPHGINLLTLGPLGRAFASLLKLCLIDEPGWDLSLVRNNANLPFYLEELWAVFERVGRELDGRQMDKDKGGRWSLFSGCARAVKVVRAWYEGKIGYEVPIGGRERGTEDFGLGLGLNMGTGSGNGSGSGGGVTGGGGEMEGWSALDDAYWLDLMGDWSFQA